MLRVVIPDYLAPPADVESALLAGVAEVECLQARHRDDLGDRLAAADGVLLFHEIALDRPVIETMSRCRVIVRCGAGYDNVDLEAAGGRGIRVCNVPDYGIDEVADHAWGLLLACSRGIMTAERTLRHRLAPWGREALGAVPRLHGRTLGIVGCGRIGSAVARRAHAFKLEVIACDPYLRAGMDKVLGVERVAFDELLARSDFLSLHAPLTAETRHLIDGPALARMKRGAILVNTARGGLVDEDALVAALRAGSLAGAAIDVLPSEPPSAGSPLMKLWQEDADPPWNCLVTPHTAYYSEESMREMRTKGVEELLRVLRDEPPRSCVNEPWLRH